MSQQTWPIISACHWEPFRGINRAAVTEGSLEYVEWHGTKGHLEIARCSRTHCERLRYSPLARPRPSVPCKSAERREMGTRNCISVSLPLTFPALLSLPSSRCNQFRRLRKPHLFSRNRIFRSSSSPASIFIEKIPLGTAPAAVVLRQGAASNGAA